MALFAEYAPPGVYVQTFADVTVTNFITGLRLPVFIGVGAEQLELSNFQVIRGSSATADIAIVGEDESSQFDGSNRTFTVSHYPVVSGTGQGIVSNDPTVVSVTIDSNDGLGPQPTQVIALVGSTGTVTLGVIPPVGAIVVASYYFSRKDTLVTNEDDGVQADGVNKVFQVDNFPIVSGDNSGTPTTNPALVTVKVAANGLLSSAIPVTVVAVNGSAGQITLASAPPSGAAVFVTYYYNMWRNTFDFLPQNINITSVDAVGMAPNKSNYFQGTDFVIFNDSIYWGAANNVAAGVVQALSTPLDAPQVVDNLVDNQIFLEQATGLSNSLNLQFVLGYVPVDGTGTDTVTNNPTLMTAYVGPDPETALMNGAVKIQTCTGATRTITLKVAPTPGNNVYVSYYYSLLSDDTWTVTNTLANVGPTPGEYSVSSAIFGLVNDAQYNEAGSHVAASGFEIEGVTFPNGQSDVQALPENPMENVLITFTSSTAFAVTSNIPSASGGSSGYGNLNQTYIDGVTGLRFTILSPISFSYAPADYLEIVVQPTFFTGQNSKSVHGTNLEVTTTLGIAVGNTAVVTVFNTDGNQPAVGDEYYVSVQYEKTNFQPAVYTNIKDVISNFGPITVENRLTLAANIAFLNSCPAVALSQVLVGENGVDAPDSAYIAAINALETPLPGDIRPNIMVALSTSPAVTTYVNQHCIKVSSERYAMERTGMFGFAIGTTAIAAQNLATSLSSNRMVGVYPDGAIVAITDPYGNSVQSAIDGTFLAAGLAGLACNPAYDVATPLTRKGMVGLVRLYRNLDAVTANQCAAAGLTVMVESGASIVVRHALTTDLSTVFSKEPTITYIQDYVQQLTRKTCNQFIGTKFLPQSVSNIQIALANMFKSLVQAQIVVAYQGIEVTPDPIDPTTADVVAYYSPVFPLNYIAVTYTLTTSVTTSTS